jgi:hypothetical protein
MAKADRRHRILKQQFWVTTWAEYDAVLHGRGRLTVWFTDGVIAAWMAEPRTTQCSQPRHSALAITTALTLGAVFRLPLRQTDGADRLNHRPSASRSGRARPQHPEPPGRDVGSAAAPHPGPEPALCTTMPRRLGRCSIRSRIRSPHSLLTVLSVKIASTLKSVHGIPMRACSFHPVPARCRVPWPRRPQLRATSTSRCLLSAGASGSRQPLGTPAAPRSRRTSAG